MARLFRLRPVTIQVEGRVDWASDEEAGAQENDERDQKELLGLHATWTVDRLRQAVKQRSRFHSQGSREFTFDLPATQID
jgi:hypothetical protein